MVDTKVETGNKIGSLVRSVDSARQLARRKGADTTNATLAARRAHIANFRAWLAPEATDPGRASLVEDAIALETTILRAQNTVQKRYGRRLPDAKGLAACVSAKNAVLQRLGRLPKQADDTPTPATSSADSRHPKAIGTCACAITTPAQCAACWKFEHRPGAKP